MHQLAIARTARVMLLAAACSMLMPALAASTFHPVLLHGLFHHSAYDKAQHMREALNGREQLQRTRHDYDRVLDAYRNVYHNDPANPKADVSVVAVAELLAEYGRLFNDDKAFHDAIGQYEFLRHQYPHSRLCPSSLLTEAEIYATDLGDKVLAKATYQQFLKLYPHSPLTSQARAELKTLHREELAAHSTKGKILTGVEGAPRADAEKTASSKLTRGSDATPDSTFPRAQSSPAKVVHGDPPSGSTVQPTPSNIAAAAPVSQAVPLTPARTRHGKTPLITSIRHWSTNVYTRVAIDLDEEVQYEAARVPNPDRIFFDLHGVKLSPELIGRAVEVTDDGYLKRIRAAQFSNDVTRIVLDVSDVSDYSAFLLPNPYRLIIDIHGRKPGSPPTADAVATTNATPQPDNFPPQSVAASTSTQSPPAIAISKSGARPGTPPTEVHPAQPSSLKAPGATQAMATTLPARQATPQSRTTAGLNPGTNPTVDSSMDSSSVKKSSSLEEVAGLSRQKNRIEATSHPTTAPISASVAGTTPAPQQSEAAASSLPRAENTSTKRGRSRKVATMTDAIPAGDAVANVSHEAALTSMGQRSLVRALGLKIGRIVVDAGHGGHDSGTLGPDGIEEKEVVLDVALRLGKLLKQRLGADVIYTRDDDTFVPLETRTAIANKAQADLFISVHANSSQDPSSRGVETYYLNFTSSPDALEVAARENAVSDQSIHQLSDLVKKITLKDKIDESREFAGDVQQNLFSGLEDGNRGMRDRGVKKAPFVVLIGANMPSILAEISFLTNPDDARKLRDQNYRQRIAESLYRGVAKYVSGLSGVRLAQGGPHTSGN